MRTRRRSSASARRGGAFRPSGGSSGSITRPSFIIASVKESRQRSKAEVCVRRRDVNGSFTQEDFASTITTKTATKEQESTRRARTRKKTTFQDQENG